MKVHGQMTEEALADNKSRSIDVISHSDKLARERNLLIEKALKKMNVEKVLFVSAESR
jgi:hypothetical protein